ncbi:carboxypeptidase Y-deficient [Entophlyctis sp. JEL0112]|nr:carboxypeptidase Y-deficient [Entophlyctis sp. JEL0112]
MSLPRPRGLVASDKQRTASLGSLRPPRPPTTGASDSPNGTDDGQNSRARASSDDVPTRLPLSPPLPSRPPPAPSTAPAAATGAMSMYACPICGQDTKNLLHLNNHLDRVHAISVDNGEDDDPGRLILNWFKKTGESAQRVLKETGENLGLKKTASSDVLSVVAAEAGNAIVSNILPSDGSDFDLNPNIPASSNSSTVAAPQVSAPPTASPAITQRHWQPDTEGPMRCSLPSCSTMLVATGVKMGKMVLGAAGVGAPRVHCRKCGRIFCEAHVPCQMRLRPTDATHDPVDGVWARVCLPCFESKDGYWDSNGVTRRRTVNFLKFRSGMSDVVQLEMNKLESRYEKVAFRSRSNVFLTKRFKQLTQLYADNPVKPPSKKTISRLRNSVLPSGPNYRDLDQSVVVWQNDSDVTNCPICKDTTAAATEPSATATVPTTSSAADHETGWVGEIKACADCRRLVFRLRLTWDIE